MLIGNPAEPQLLENGLRTSPSWWSFRFGYFDDWVYQQTFHDEFTQIDMPQGETTMELSTYAGLLTFNIKNRVDIYGIVGSSRIQLDEETFSKRALAWGIGSKGILFKSQDFCLGLDVKYFETYQKPKYFVVENLPYNIVSRYKLKYHEIQAALGLSYRIWNFVPYVNATYLLSHIEPTPPVLLVRLPDLDEVVDVYSKSVVGKNHWGLAAGLTLIDCAMVSLSFEWRLLNQNAINVNGEIRF